MKLDRILITAPSSGSGKTLVTCGLLGILKKRGLKTASFKCGPDFIDPMFHTKVIGTKTVSYTHLGIYAAGCVSERNHHPHGRPDTGSGQGKH